MRLAPLAIGVRHAEQDEPWPPIASSPSGLAYAISAELACVLLDLAEDLLVGWKPIGVGDNIVVKGQPANVRVLAAPFPDDVHCSLSVEPNRMTGGGCESFLHVNGANLHAGVRPRLPIL